MINIVEMFVIKERPNMIVGIITIFLNGSAIGKLLVLLE